MNFFKFFFTRFFWSNLGLAALVLVLLGFVSTFLLKSCTHHGEKIEIPDLKGVPIEKAATILQEKQLKYQIIDTVFYEEMPKLSIAEQIPAKGTFVKAGRVVYLTINAPQAPKIEVPDVTGKSLRIATSILESAGFKIGEITRKPDIANDVVLKMDVEPGSRLPKGSAIPLTVAQGDGEDTEVPDLTGLTLQEAMDKLEEAGLSETHLFDEGVSDTTEATIYKIRPSVGKKVTKGTAVDLYLK